MTPFDDFVYLVNSILLGEEPVSILTITFTFNSQYESK